MTRDYGHSTGDDPETNGHCTGHAQRLRTYYRWTRDCRHSTGDDQRLADIPGSTPLDRGTGRIKEQVLLHSR
ncbi:unnamed protein product, partial [Staurois parvus]